MENPKSNRSADNPARPDRPTVILCYRGNRPARPLAFELDAVDRFRAFLRLSATTDGRALLRSDPQWAGYLRLDTLDRYLTHQEESGAGG